MVCCRPIKKIAVALLVLFVISIAQASDFEVNSLHYKITSNIAPYTVAVTYPTPNLFSYYGEIIIPESVEHNGKAYTVTAIGFSAFAGCRKLVSVSIPNTVVKIEQAAFSCCTGLKSVHIPNSVEEICQSAFFGCQALETLKLGKSLSRIGNGAFASAKKLKKLSVSSENRHFRSKDNVLYTCSFDTLVLCPAGKKGSFEIPAAVSVIGNYAFHGCDSLTSVSFHNGVRSLGENAFENCFMLNKVSIPQSVVSIGNSAFGYCLSMSEFVVDKGNKRYSSCDGVLCTKCRDTIVAYPIGRSDRGYVVPSTVKHIGNSSFMAAKLSYLEIPNTVQSVGDHAFEAAFLDSIHLGQSLVQIGESAFLRCIRLKSVVIPNSLKDIGESAFMACMALTDVTIGDSVLSIGEGAFFGCENLENVSFGLKVGFVKEFAFMGCKSLKYLEFKGATPPVFGLDVFDALLASGAVKASLGIGNANSFVQNATQTKVTVPCGTEKLYSDSLWSWFDDVVENCADE